MRFSFSIITAIVSVVLLSSCEKEEKPVTLPPKPDDVKLLTVNMGNEYTSQIFVDLGSGKTTTIDNLSWDLAFDASASGTSIFQNSGKNIMIANTGSTQFKANPVVKSVSWNWDPASGYKDSLTLKNCVDQNGNPTDSVYLIKIGSASPSYQFRIKSITNQQYIIEIADIANTWTHETVILKDLTKSQVYFSFADKGIFLNPEPSKDSWHICFLRYRWIYYEFNPPFPYLVSGVFINPSFVSAVKDSVLDFYSLTKADCAAKTLLSSRDVIGYDWKSPDLSNTSNVKYTIRKDYYYFIREKTQGQRLFKLRFLDFYSDQGVKGNPSFETQQID